MIRRAACIVLAMTLNAAPVRAQDTVLTVSVDSADVFKGPSNVTPVIGHVSRGTVLLVARNLGSWVRISWPAAADGVGYVHVSMGRLSTIASGAPAAVGIAPGPAASAAPANGSAPHTPDSSRDARRTIEVAPASHAIGFGAVAMSTSNYGGTIRAWRANRTGVQIGFTRERVTNDAARATFTQFEPGIVYGLMDRVTDYVWIRPYVGTVASWRRQTLSMLLPDAVAPAAETRFGYRLFGGAELTFASVPQFAISADAGYRRYSSPFAGYETERLAVALAGHWYIK